MKLGIILHPENGSEEPEAPYTQGPKATVNPKYVLSDKLWAYLQAYADKHRKAGHGFGFGLVDRDSTTRTLSARYYKDGSEILVSRGRGRNPRRLTPRECARLMGFPDTFRIPEAKGRPADDQPLGETRDTMPTAGGCGSARCHSNRRPSIRRRWEVHVHRPFRRHRWTVFRRRSRCCGTKLAPSTTRKSTV
jgi:C-5 cytosine-specific DNA methylase